MLTLLLPASWAFGLPCGDLDRNGVFEIADRQLLREHLAGMWATPLDAEQLSLCLVAPQSTDCDIVQAAALGLGLAGEPLAACPAGDDDDDDVPNQDDDCVDSIGIGPPVTVGCSALDLVSHPEALLGPLTHEVADLIRIADGSDGGDPASAALTAAATQLEAAASSMRRGDPCQAQFDLNQAVLALETTSGVVDSWMDSDLAANPPPADESDVSEGETYRTFLLSLRDHVDGAIPLGTALAASAGEMCGTVVTLDVSDVVEEVDDARRRLRLRSGDYFLLAEGASIAGAVSEGSEVAIAGTGFGAGSGVATSIVASSPISGANPTCLVLRFTPVQAQRPFRIGPPKRLDPEGYYSVASTVYMMEHGMGLAAVRFCPAPPSNTAFEHHYLTVLASFAKRGGGTETDLPIAPELTPLDEPALLPGNIDPSEPVTLTVIRRLADCTRSLGSGGGLETTCVNHRSLGSTQYSVELREQGERCSITYNQRAFVVDEFDPTDFAQAQVTQATTQAPNTSGVFRAEARPFCTSGGYAPCPYFGTVLQGNSFAIQNVDFLAIHPNFGAQMIFARGLHGVRRAAGLRWPRVQGVNQSLEFQYSCIPPVIARDALHLCQGSTTDTFYRLPFEQGSPDWTLTQGNNSGGNNSHAMSYALDMTRNFCGETITAMRTGRVWALRDGRTCQSNANCTPTPGTPICNSNCCGDECTDSPESPCKGNWVRLRHQDDSYSLYHHLRPDTIQVQVGELVRRGEAIGGMGTTGPSSGVHLHTSAENPPIPERLAGKGHLALFEAESLTPGPDLNCYEPQQSDPLRSTNTPPPP